jgi:ribonucleotide monophosphatase NagD (HAD superfamily)
MALSPLLSLYDHVLLDLDGCVWVQDALTPHARDALSAIRGAGKGLAFVTNDSRQSPEEYVRKLWSLGLQASLEEVVTVGAAIQFLLAERVSGAPTFVIGSAAVFRHVAESGQRIVNDTPHAAEAELVVVAGHDGFDYDELRIATQALLGGAGTGRFPRQTGNGRGRDRSSPPWNMPPRRRHGSSANPSR